LEVGEEGGFKLDLRQDCYPGKQKLKGAIRTETYQRHYCQQADILIVGVCCKNFVWWSVWLPGRVRINALGLKPWLLDRSENRVP
jgi:hypothetical protein